MTKTKIIKICKKYNIVDYIINKDNSIDVNGDVNLINLNLKKLPLNFNIVKDNFNCSHNKLETLEGAPKECKFFNCSYNNLTSLKGAPEKCNYFNCSYNK